MKKFIILFILLLAASPLAFGQWSGWAPASSQLYGLFSDSVRTGKLITNTIASQSGAAVGIALSDTLKGRLLRFTNIGPNKPATTCSLGVGGFEVDIFGDMVTAGDYYYGKSGVNMLAPTLSATYLAIRGVKTGAKYGVALGYTDSTKGTYADSMGLTVKTPGGKVTADTGNFKVIKMDSLIITPEGGIAMLMYNATGDSVGKGWGVAGGITGRKQFSTLAQSGSGGILWGITYSKINNASWGYVVYSGIVQAAFKKDRTDSARMGTSIYTDGDSSGKFNILAGNNIGTWGRVLSNNPIKQVNTYGDTLVWVRIFEETSE